MTDKEWLQIIVTLPYVLILSLAGGLSAFIMRLNKATEPIPLKTVYFRLCGELFLSGFAGLTTFLLCNEWGVSPNLTAVAVAISGHLGGNAIALIAKYVEKFFNQKIGDDR